MCVCVCVCVCVCANYGMKINQSKTKFFVICGSLCDRESLRLDGLVVEPCKQYVYLGSPFMCDRSASSAVKAHARTKMSHVNKFVSFLKKNNDVPFIVKKNGSLMLHSSHCCCTGVSHGSTLIYGLSLNCITYVSNIYWVSEQRIVMKCVIWN